MVPRIQSSLLRNYAWCWYQKCGVTNYIPLLFLCADFQEPYAVVVLLEKDLVVIDLAQNGWGWRVNNPSPLLHSCHQYHQLAPIIFIQSFHKCTYSGKNKKKKSNPVCALWFTVTPYSRTPILWLSTSLLWPAASTLPTARWTSYLHFTLWAHGRSDRDTAKRSFIRKILLVNVWDEYFTRVEHPSR